MTMQNFKSLGWLMIAICALALGGIMSYRTVVTRAGESSALPEGAIVIPQDLRERFDAATKVMETSKKTFEAAQGTVQQCIRVTLDRAGVIPEEFPNYEWDQTCNGNKGCIKKKGGAR